MPPTNFPQYQAAAQPEAFTPQPFAVPAELQQALEEINARSRPAGVSPEQAAKRRAQNDLDTQFGMLMQLTGDEAAGGIGASVLKKALAARTPQVTEKGWANPETGEFTYDPDYLQRQDDADRQRILGHIANARTNYQSQQDAAGNRRFEASERAKDRMALEQYKLENKPATLVPIMGADGQVHYGPKVEGAIPGATSQGQPGEDEKKAAGWYDQAATALNTMHEASQFDPKSATPTFMEKMSSMVPGETGKDIAYAAMSPARQKFTTAASSLSEALLRAATGAGINVYEAQQKVNEMTPRWGEDPTVTDMKQRNAYVYLQSLKTRAGRAKTTVVPTNAPSAGMPAGAASAPGARASSPQDPLGLLGG